MGLRTPAQLKMYAIAAESLPVDLVQCKLLDPRTGRTDMVGHILLLAGWKRTDIYNQIAPEFLWDSDGVPTWEAAGRLGYAKLGVLVVEELMRLADLGSRDDMVRTLYRLANMPVTAEFRVRLRHIEEDDD